MDDVQFVVQVDRGTAGNDLYGTYDDRPTADKARDQMAEKTSRRVRVRTVIKMEVS